MKTPITRDKGLLAPQYRDENAAREHIEAMFWKDGPVCPHCGLVNEATKLEPREGSKRPVRKGLWNCRGCRQTFTVTIGTIFEDSHIPLHKWLFAIHLMGSSKKGVSAHQLMRNLGIGSYRSAWYMAHRIRWALTQTDGPFKGTVEADETYIGGKPRAHIPHATKLGERPQDHYSRRKAPVLAVLQRGGSVRSEYVPRVTANALKPMIRKLLAKRAHLMTDTSSVLASVASPYKYSQVNHSKDEYARYEKNKLITTNTVESYFALLKRGSYGIYHHWSVKYLPQYLREFDWRYNVRKLSDTDRAAVALRMTSGKRLMLKSGVK